MNILLSNQAARIEKFISTRENQLRLLALLVVIVIGTVAWFARSNLTSLKSLGYPGIFALSLISSSTVLVPVPGIASVCGGSSFLNPVALAIVAALGETLGELSGYALGFSGKGILEKRNIYYKMHTWLEKRGAVTLFIASLVPNPIFDVVGITAGALRYPIPRFLVVVLSGKSIKNLGVVYACVFAIDIVISIFQG
ncbi:MAG: DedA family protein [Chloroflexi bacterium]|nr:DedA family protein [Chloroflexota bacterium]